MKRSFMETEVWKWIRTLLQVIGFALVIWGILAVIDFLSSAVKAEEAEHGTSYAICMKGDVVNVRSGPKTRAEWIGWIEPGDEVETDGRRKNGFVHCVNMNTESGDGWVFAGYLTGSKPELADCDATVVSNGRLAARKYVDGKRTKWLKNGQTVHIYYLSDEWCSTNVGYIQTKYLQPEE